VKTGDFAGLFLGNKKIPARDTARGFSIQPK
jgi:hypothetical protein